MTETPATRILRLGTRGSRLALVQTESVRKLLSERGGFGCEIVVIKTSGDRVQDRPLAEIGGKGLFTKELENALFANEIDCAVHSMKDVPAIVPSGLAIGAVLPREDVRDAFVSPVAGTLQELPERSRIGTSSVRRSAQVARARPDLEIVSLRGNVDTRLSKLEAGLFDAILLAYAGMKRLGLEHRATSLLPPETWLPALSQGAIGIEIRNEDAFVARAVAALNDLATEIALACERAFQAALDGSCRTPIAGLATCAGGRVVFRGEIFSLDGRQSAETRVEQLLGPNAVLDAAALGRAAGEELKARSGHLLST